MKIKLTLLVDHRTLGRKGSIIEVPEEYVDAYLKSGKVEYSEKPKEEEPKKSKKKR